MRPGDPRFDSFPQEPGAAQLRWYVQRTAEGVLTIQELLADFRTLHEAIERDGPPLYASPAEARALWDVLWAVEFCSANLTHATKPEDWYIADEVLAVVKRAARQLDGTGPG